MKKSQSSQIQLEDVQSPEKKPSKGPKSTKEKKLEREENNRGREKLIINNGGTVMANNLIPNSLTSQTQTNVKNTQSALKS